MAISFDEKDIQLDVLDDKADYDALYKLILLGDGAVGKTAIGTRFCKGLFQSGYKMTIGADFFIKAIRFDNRNVKYQIWDVAGQQRFKHLRNTYYRGASCGILVYDTTVYESFGNLENWVLEFQEECGNTPVVVVGNKIDLPDRNVSTEEASNFSQYVNGPYLEASAKSGININRLFKMVYGVIKENKTSIMIPKVRALPLEQAFGELEQVLQTETDQTMVNLAMKICRYSIFKEVPFSITVQNMTQWIHYLENYGWNEESRKLMLENIPAWKHNYTIINIDA